ncbi:hypothetical protein [Paenibacillus tyrfis]|uniref:hypothetical protein n=1 Tax=Paenibacillus tyrfis TaxID=1501230 RepID=UPI000B59751F|nr:hypothetical protein [Paenibacillus tyrfis]
MKRAISRTAAGLLLALLLAGCEEERQAAPASGTIPSAPSAGEASQAAFPYKQEIAAAGLAVPWEIDFAPDGSLYKQGEAGLLSFALDTQFARNGYMYAYHTYIQGDRLRAAAEGRRQDHPVCTGILIMN